MSNQIVNLHNTLKNISPDMFVVDWQYYKYWFTQLLISLNTKNLNNQAKEIIPLLKELDQFSFDAQANYDLSLEAHRLVTDVRRKTFSERNVPDVSDLILKLNQLSEMGSQFYLNEKKLRELFHQLLTIMQKAPKKEVASLQMDWGQDLSTDLSDFNFLDLEESETKEPEWDPNYWVNKIEIKIKQFDVYKTIFFDITYFFRGMIPNIISLIHEAVKIEGFAKQEDEEEDDEEDFEYRMSRIERRQAATTQLYLLLNSLNISQEHINKFINYLISNQKYPKDEKLDDWDPDLLKLVSSKHQLDQFSPEEIFKIVTANLNFLELKFKEDKEIMAHVRKKVLNSFYGNSSDSAINVDLDKTLDNTLYFLKEKFIYLHLDEEAKKTLYRFVSNNFDTIACIKLLEMFNTHSFSMFLQFYNQYIKKIDLGILMSGKLYKFYDALPKIEGHFDSIEFRVTLAAIKELQVKDDDRIIAMMHRSKMINTMLHNNNYGTPLVSSYASGFDFADNSFITDLFISMMGAKWDLKQDVTDKFINIGLNSKIDELINSSQERGQFNKLNEIAAKLSIDLNRFRQDLLEIRSIIAQGQLIPFSWREKVYQVDNDLNGLLSGEILLQYGSEAKPKDEKLFQLNYQLGNDLRFEVLPDMSVEHFKVGAATQCCQRPGGAAETAMIDSFINPLAGVLVLRKGREIISQSYFHYVPEDNGYILDNVEANQKLTKKYNLNLDNLYANLAQKLKQEYQISYFKCGKEYNKLNDDAFQDSKLSSDPRHFELEDEVYSDFSNKDHIDLSLPAFPLTPVAMTKKQATRLDRLIKLANVFSTLSIWGHNKYENIYF